MLIYNFQKEFIGIDEKDLRALGFKNLAELRTEVIDFADLFVKTPGHIHNFKHVHWIDFVVCGESNEESRVIINVNSKNYTATISVFTAYLTDSPSSKAYLVHLNNLRALSQKESEHISGDIVAREPVSASLEPEVPIFGTPNTYNDNFTQTEPEVIPETKPTNITLDPYESPLSIDMEDDVFQDSTAEFNEEPVATPTFEESKPQHNDLDIKIDMPDITIEEPKQEKIQLETVQETEQEEESSYVYDPQIASEELGLPIDLIEEFIQDFIAQAKEFKTPIYDALGDGDIDNVKILSHKLKGVAANLRIEDAFEVLSVINTAEDTNIIDKNLSIFYKIISKLAGEEISTPQTLEPTKEPKVEEEISEVDEIVIDFKDEDEDDAFIDPIEIKDENVPDKIEMPELADDTFVSDDELNISIEDEFDNSFKDEKLDISLEDELELEPESEPEVEQNTQDDIKTYYSLSKAAAEIGIDLESFKELFKDFTIESKETIKEIENHISNNDLKSAQNLAIKLRGMSENMRIDEFILELDSIINAKSIDSIAKDAQKIDAILNKLSLLED